MAACFFTICPPPSPPMVPVTLWTSPAATCPFCSACIPCTLLPDTFLPWYTPLAPDSPIQLVALSCGSPSCSTLVWPGAWSTWWLQPLPSQGAAALAQGLGWSQNQGQNCHCCFLACQGPKLVLEHDPELLLSKGRGAQVVGEGCGRGITGGRQGSGGYGSDPDWVSVGLRAATFCPPA